MKKILLISPQPFFQWRGSPIRVGFNVQALSQIGYTVDLLTLPIGEPRDYEGVEIIRVANPFGIEQIPIGPSLNKIVFDILLLFRGLQLIRRHNYSVVHGVEEAGIIALFLSRLAKCRLIFEKHSDPFSYKKGFLKNILLSIYSVIERVTVKYADAVICTGQGLVEQVEKMGTDTRAFHIFDIPSSLVEPAPEHSEQIRGDLRQQNEVLVAFVGSFAIYQGIELLFATIPEVVKESPDVRFIIIGGTDSEIRERQLFLQQNNVSEKVSFVGMIPPDTLPDYLSACDILLSPRISGVNTPLKLLDYLKAGRAIVATDVDANRLILDKDVARLAKPEPDEMAAAIVSLVEDEEARKAMGEKGRYLFENKYNFTNYTKKLKACYEFVLTKES